MSTWVPSSSCWRSRRFRSDSSGRLGVEIIQGLEPIIWALRALKTFFAASHIGAIWRVLACGIVHVVAAAILFSGLAAAWLLVVPGG